MTDRIVATSKFLSFVLRHQPEAIGIELDSEGWVDIATLLDAARRTGHRDGRKLDRALVEEVVRTNDKRRFALSSDGLRIRAVQGHSTDTVQLRHHELTPPPRLFHGTATRFLAAIREQGLRPGSRHHVHLSQDEATATAVGRRHGQPVVLRIDAAAMHAAGHAFYQAENGVWLTAEVPAPYLALPT